MGKKYLKMNPPGRVTGVKTIVDLKINKYAALGL